MVWLLVAMCLTLSSFQVDLAILNLLAVRDARGPVFRCQIPGRRRCREQHTHLLFAELLFRGTHLEAADVVDAEHSAILRDLLELRGGRRQDVRDQDFAEAVVELDLAQAGLVGDLELGGYAILLDLEARCPRAREVCARVACLEAAVEEVQLAALQQGLLLVDEATELGGVLHVGIRRDERITLACAVALRGAEDLDQQLLVLGLEVVEVLFSQAPQEGPSQGHLGFQGIWTTTAWRQTASEALWLGQVELVQIQIHTLRHLCPLSELEPLGHEHGSARLPQLHTRLALESMALCQLKAVEPELHTTVDGLQIALATSEHINEPAILQLNAGVTAHVPQLRDLWMCFLRRGLHNLVGKTVPRWIQARVRVDQVLGQHGRLRQLPDMVDDALALRYQVEVASEGVGELLQRMCGSRDRRIFQPLLGNKLLAGLHAHLHERDQGLVLRQPHLGLLHHVPLAPRPGFVLIGKLGPIEHAQHAGNGHLVLAEGKLLQEVVGLEHDVTHASAGQPAGFIHLLLRSFLQVLWVNWVKGEQRLAGGCLPHL
mmetsp:Transcript_47306/g.97632  ORF Transcript_47306/g.97632 Transcript_47306/m.97632 type:complete len:545 (+) Transcript_47306:756-2390(+)